MANVVLSAQHYLECENCEENPAIFMCKTCPGHLCENCKTEHEMKKNDQKPRYYILKIKQRRLSGSSLLF